MSYMIPASLALLLPVYEALCYLPTSAAMHS